MLVAMLRWLCFCQQQERVEESNELSDESAVTAAPFGEKADEKSGAKKREGKGAVAAS